jgi:hypothetical protein
VARSLEAFVGTRELCGRVNAAAERFVAKYTIPDRSSGWPVPYLNLQQAGPIGLPHFLIRDTVWKSAGTIQTSS